MLCPGIKRKEGKIPVKGAIMKPQKQITGADSPLEIEEQGTRYRVSSLHDGDPKRLAEYQRLRALTFVQRLGWQIPVDAEGKEADHYDSVEAKSFVSLHGVYGLNNQEHFLGGVRIFTLRTWSDSMIENEFHTVGMIPQHTLQFLKRQYSCTDLLELTRLCVQPSPTAPFRQIIARDFTYASVYALAQKTGRRLALALVDSLYFQVMRRSNFIFREIYTHRLDQRQGHALVVIDLWETIRSIRAHGNDARAARMLALCA
jgi:N-acyl-L-homoserine lactone synthetase